MATITKGQVCRINEKCKNGFMLDVQTAVIWGRKDLVKEIILDESGVIYRFRLSFEEETENFTKIGVRPFLDIDKLIPAKTPGIYCVTTLKTEILGDLLQRKNIKVLQNLTVNYPDEKVAAIIRELMEMAA